MKNFFANLIDSLHFLIVIVWCGLFLVPQSWFPNKVSFHFYLTLTIVGHQFLWTAFLLPWTKKYQMTCILTTFTQLLRGKKISDPKNYKHSFTQEIFRKINIPISRQTSAILTLAILTAVTIQYFLYIGI